MIHGTPSVYHTMSEAREQKNDQDQNSSQILKNYNINGASNQVKAQSPDYEN
jgi:hypothetical protein